MSAETHAALTEALAAHVADETDGAMLGGFVMYCETQTLDQLDQNATGYFAEYAKGITAHAAQGLVELHRERLLFEVRAGWDG